VKYLPTPIRQTRSSRRFTLERLECSLILTYGVTNVFLEHLSGWGKAWTAQDLEHVAISVLFIGGGLVSCPHWLGGVFRNILTSVQCGLMIEYHGYGKLTRHEPNAPDASYPTAEKQPSTSAISINPINPLIIFLLGKILAGHGQDTGQSTMMHSWVGNLLAGAAAARILTYLLMYLAPPSSNASARAPSESVTSFCLMTAGLLLMASNSDTVDAMIRYKVNAMMVATMAMSTTAASMAWFMALFAMGQWARGTKARSRADVGVQ
jgi:hypothetical protein